jgi:7-keto-8-aminopelargonate synthetase-like enzyme
MNQVPEFVELVKEGINKYGLLFPSSRISNTRLKLYKEFEELLSSITGSEETVCFSSGFIAGRVATSMSSKIINAPYSHPAIKKQKDFPGSYEVWKDNLIKAVNSSPNADAIVFAGDAINALTATVNDFSFLNEMERRVIAIIDDSHGIGLIGMEGKGIASLVPKQKNVDYIFTYSLSKAYGLPGGAISSSKQQAESVKASAEFTAGTSVSPAFIYAFLHAQHLYKQQRQKLQANIQYFQTLIVGLSQIQSHPDLPIFILPEEVDEEYLFKKGIIISSFAYPDPSGKKIQRIILNALHTKEDLRYIADMLA